MQEQAQLKVLVQQAGGDPTRTIEALMRSGNHRAIELAMKIKSANANKFSTAGDGILNTTTGGIGPNPYAKEQRAQNKSNLSRLMAERDSLPQGDPRRQSYENAIRKESETAKQISPTVVMPRPTEPLVAVIDPVTGKAKLVERKDAVGLVPAGTGAKAEAVEAGKADVANDIITLKASLDALNEGGGITSTEKGVASNVGRWASTTGPGQLLGTMGGTVNQKHRDIISQARPLLMRSIMQATGMSAKQMDSNAELKLWLSTATDPTKGYEANIEAMNNIDRKYGSGGFMGGGQTSGGKINPSRRADDVPAGVDPKVWGAMTPAEKKLFK